MSAGSSRNAGSAAATDSPDALRIGGVTPLTTTDFPGALAAVVFCQGCALRCRYCHNPHLLPRRGERATPWQAVSAFLERRRGLLDAVVFSGGEPTLQPALPAALRAVKALGYATGLHTAGVHPQRLREVLPLLDWVGLDIKAPFDDYARLTGAPCGARARESLEAVLASGVDYEVRTTVHAALLPPAALEALSAQLASAGVQHYALQEFRPVGCNADPGEAPGFLTESYCAEIRTRFTEFTVRRA